MNTPEISIIVDAAADTEFLATCLAALQVVASEAQVELILAVAEPSGVGEEKPPPLGGGGSPQCVQPKQLAGATRAERLNLAAKAATADLLLFLRPSVICDATSVLALRTVLDRDLEIAMAVPKLLTRTGETVAAEFILIEDECKRKPIDVLLRPSKLPESKPWPTPPLDGIAYSGDAVLIRKSAFWGVGGWPELETENRLLQDLSLGLALKEQHWRNVLEQASTMVSLNPAPDISLSPAENQALVRRWYGAFLPHGRRAADGIIRSHPYWEQGIGGIGLEFERVETPFAPIPLHALVSNDRIPGGVCSVIVVTYNSEAALGDCAASILKHSGIFDELIFVDNASRDGTPRLLEELRESDPRVKVILNERNLGFSDACNQGIEISTGEFVTLLNPDTEVAEGWLGRMRHYFSDPSVGAVGPISNGAWGLQGYPYHFPVKVTGKIPPSEVQALATQVNARLAVETKLLIGFCMMLRREAIDKVGWLDPELFLGCDDLDLSWRLRLAGYRLLIATDVFVLHEGHMSFKTDPVELTTELNQRSTDALARKLAKHYGRGNVPDQLDLWGIDWFLPSPEAWEEAAA